MSDSIVDDDDDEIDGDGFSDRDDDREEKNVHFNSFQISRLFYGLVKKWAKTKEQKRNCSLMIVSKSARACQMSSI